jgi:serine/threonine-protein kinase RsbW
VLLELITNAIIHGNKFNPDKKTVAVIDVGPDSITVGVLDDGEGYNEKTVPNPLLPENLTKQHGRGLFIVKYFVDEFKLRGNGNCTVVKMNRKLEKK